MNQTATDEEGVETGADDSGCSRTREGENQAKKEAQKET